MGVGSGLGGQFGFGAETTYGTTVTPTRFLPVIKADLKAKPMFTMGMGIAAGQFIDAGSQRILTTHDGNGAVDLELQTSGFGLLLQALMGTTVTPVQQSSSTAYLQTHTLNGDNLGKILTLQAGVPDLGGVVRPYTLSGGKVMDATFSFDIKATGPIMTSWTFDGQDVVETQALAAASYVLPPPRAYVGTDVVVKAGVFGSEVQVDGVPKVDVKITRPMKIDRQYLGNSGRKKEPITNGRIAVTGTITADFVDKTLWADKFPANTPFSLIISTTGALISGTFYQNLTINLPQCFIDGDTPGLMNMDVVNGAFPFRCLYDGTHQPSITYQSTDVTL
jgi:hypothetical protein